MQQKHLRDKTKRKVTEMVRRRIEMIMIEMDHLQLLMEEEELEDIIITTIAIAPIITTKTTTTKATLILIINNIILAKAMLIIFINKNMKYTISLITIKMIMLAVDLILNGRLMKTTSTLNSKLSIKRNMLNK